MDAATKVQITGLLFTLVLPVGAAAATLFVGRRWLKNVAPPLLTGAAVLLGVLVAVLGAGAPGLPPGDADDWLFYGPLIAGAIGLAFDGPLKAAGRFAFVVPLLVLPLLGWQIGGRLASLWSDGVALPLATSAWLLDGLLIALVVWLAVDHVAAAEPVEGVRSAPLLLGPLALALAGTAITIGLTGSARVAQLIGGSAAVVGVVGLAGWRWPVLVPGRGAAFTGLALLVGGVLMARFFVDVPRPVVTLTLLAPLGALAARRASKTLPAVVIGVVVSGLLVGAALEATLVNEAAKAAAVEKKSGGDDSGTYYPY